MNPSNASTQYAREHEIFQLDGEEATTSSLALKQLSEELIQVQKQRIEQESKHEILADKSRTLADRVGVLEKDASYLQALGQKLDKLKAQQEKQPIANLAEQIKKLENDIEIEVSAKRDSLKGELGNRQKERGTDP